MDLISRKLLIGSVALLIVAILNPLNFYDWLIDTLFGIAISAMFLSPIASLIIGERRVTTPIFIGIGLILFLIYTYHYLDGDFVAAFIFLCEWLAVFAFISVIFQLIFTEVKEEVVEWLKK